MSFRSFSDAFHWLRLAALSLISGTRMAGAQLSGVLRAPGALSMAAASIAGRLPRGMFPLACLIAVENATGSLALASGAAALLALGDAGTVQVKGLLVDRFGRPAALGGAALLGVLATVAFLLALAGSVHVGVLVSAFLIGVGTPPISASIKALWPRVAPPGRSAASYSVESLLQQLIFLVGPLAVSAVMVVFSAVVAVAAAACMLVVGTAAYILATRGLAPVAPAAQSGSDAPVPGTSTATPRSPLRNPAVRLIAITILLQGALFGALPIVLLGAPSMQDRAELVGVVQGTMTLGGIIGTLAIARKASFRHYGRLHALLGLTLLAAAVAFLGEDLLAPVLIGAALFGAGIVVTPLSATAYELTGRSTTASRRTEAFALFSAAQAAGTALGSVLAGALGDADAYALLAFLPAALIAVVVVVVCAVSRRSHGR